MRRGESFAAVGEPFLPPQGLGFGGLGFRGLGFRGLGSGMLGYAKQK